MNKFITATVLSIGLSSLFCSQVSAHSPWINSDNYSLHSGATPHINIGWGHRYPLGRFLLQEEMENLVLHDPNGKELPMKAVNIIESEPEEALTSPGTYILTGQGKADFYTKTTEGGKLQSKEGLKNVIKCWHSSMGMKSLLTVGEKSETLDKSPAGHPLEIIPLANPASLRVRLKVRFFRLSGALPHMLLLQCPSLLGTENTSNFKFGNLLLFLINTCYIEGYN